jgi:hypothetical protein
MQHVPSNAEVNDLVRALDDLDRKVVGGLVALWMVEPARVRDREWTAERFVHVATVAHGFDATDGPASTDDVERIRAYANARMPAVLHAALALFVRVADDLRARGGGFSLADAQGLVSGYLAR